MTGFGKTAVGLVFILAFANMATGCKKKPDGPPAAEGMSGEDAEAPVVLPPPKKREGIRYFPEGTPTRAIQDLDDRLDSYIINPDTGEERRYNEALKKDVLNGTFDIRELCRRSLDRHWGDLSGGERDHHVDVMTRLMEKKAIFSKEHSEERSKKKGKEARSHALTYRGHRFLGEGEKLALVETWVDIPSEDLRIELNYKLTREGEMWKIFDVIVDGASLLDNYRYQFDRIIKRDGYSTLIHRMEMKLKELEEQGTEKGPSI